MRSILLDVGDWFAVGQRLPAQRRRGDGLVWNPAWDVSGYPSSPATSVRPIMAAMRPGAWREACGVVTSPGGGVLDSNAGRLVHPVTAV